MKNPDKLSFKEITPELYQQDPERVASSLTRKNFTLPKPEAFEQMDFGPEYVNHITEVQQKHYAEPNSFKANVVMEAILAHIGMRPTSQEHMNTMGKRVIPIDGMEVFYWDDKLLVIFIERQTSVTNFELYYGSATDK
jgi:hypothetical protein